MSGKPLRFVHTSDWHLEQPLQGVGEIPDHLRQLFLDAPFLAAERVVDTAISEQADFVILAGDILQPRAAGPRGLDFLLDQFRRLQDEQIEVYWIGGHVDRFESWPPGVPRPANVHTWAAAHVESHTFRRNGKPLAVVQGLAEARDPVASHDDFDADATLTTIAAVHGAPSAETIERSEIEYWALGGLHSPQSVTTSPLAYYSGSPQGRCPTEEGPHGCSIVDVESPDHVSRQAVSTDVVRWHTMPIELPDEIDRGGLLRMLRERTHHLLETAGSRQLLVRWVMTDSDQLSDTRSDQLAARLREGDLADDLLRSLHTEFGQDVPGVWHLGLTTEPPSVFPAGWYEEDTVLGDLLRTVQRCQQNDNGPLPFEPLPSDAKVPDEIVELLKSSSSDDRQLILRRVAALGVDLLRGDRVLSEEFHGESPT